MMRTSHFDDGHGNTVCGYPWEWWQGPDADLITNDEIEAEGNYGVRVELRKAQQRERERLETPVALCPACQRIAHRDLPTKEGR